MILDDVSQRAGFLVKRPAALHAQCFRHRDLDVIDEVAVPHRLENAVGKAEDQQVLHRFLAEVMVDAEDLALVKHRVHLVIQFARRIQVMPEGLFDDTTRPAAVLPVCAMPCAPRFSMISAKYSGAVAR